MPASPKHLITTAFLAEKNYYFVGVSDHFYPLVSSELGIDFSQRLVQVSLPSLYKHLPIHNSVLYHELGHFVDSHFGFSAMMALKNTPSGARIPQNVLNHLQEHFADLFAACYVGEAICGMLDGLAPGAGASHSHPGTDERNRIVREFLAGNQNDVVDLCNAALASLRAPLLQVRSSTPDVVAAFENMRPHTIEKREEIHGILPAALSYLAGEITMPAGQWAHLDEGAITRIVNDLVEKSIRNWMVREKWN